MSCMHYIDIVALALQYQRTHLDRMTTQSTSLLVEDDVPYMFHLVCGSTYMSCTHLMYTHTPDGACMEHFPPKVMYFVYNDSQITVHTGHDDYTKNITFGGRCSIHVPSGLWEYMYVLHAPNVHTHTKWSVHETFSTKSNVLLCSHYALCAQ